MSERVGRLAIVLHSHSPWLLGHGTWPVGEEWLRQAWAHSYLPLVRMLRERAERGAPARVTLGITPVLAAQWDRPDAIADQRRWLSDWQLRASGKALANTGYIQPSNAIALADARRQFRLVDSLKREFDEHWSAGGSAAIRNLASTGVIDLIGGPLTHAFTPHLLTPIAHVSLEAGLRDHTVRFGKRPDAIWAPECAYRPGLESVYAEHGVRQIVVDGPTIRASAGHEYRPHHIGSSDVVAFGRNLDLTYRVWSPRRGYPGNEWYQDFHTYDHEWGLRPFRVTKRTSAIKEPYEPARASEQLQRDADDFLDHARRVMRDAHVEEPLVVVAYDTELFGHWWHEGPDFLAAVFDRADDAGITLTDLTSERARTKDIAALELPPGSWGSGKDFRVWEEGEAGQLRERGIAAQYAVLQYLRELPAGWRTTRHPTADAVLTELLLGLSSDWAFMITKDSAADYARGRATHHFDRLSQLLRSAHHYPDVRHFDDRLPALDARLTPV